VICEKLANHAPINKNDESQNQADTGLTKELVQRHAAEAVEEIGTPQRDSLCPWPLDTIDAVL
jgi:hypothetical protein